MVSLFYRIFCKDINGNGCIHSLKAGRRVKQCVELHFYAKGSMKTVDERSVQSPFLFSRTQNNFINRKELNKYGKTCNVVKGRVL